MLQVAAMLTAEVTGLEADLPLSSDLRGKGQDLVPSRGENRERGRRQLLGNKLDAGHSWSRDFLLSYIYKRY